jgi:PAS domain S-box-containing protein
MPRAFLDALRVGICLVEVVSERVLFANQALGDMLGYRTKELTSGRTTFIGLTHPDDRAETERLHHRLATGKIEHYSLDKRYFHKSGRVLWVHINVSSLRDSKGKVRWCTKSVEDITARKTTEAQLKAAQAVSGLVTWNYSVKTDTSKTSPGINLLFGAPANAGLSSLESFISRIHPEDQKAVRAAIKRAVRRKAGYVLEYRIQNDGGGVRWVRSIANCICGAKGQVSNLVGATIDITHTKNAKVQAVASRPMQSILAHIEKNSDKPIRLGELAKKYGVSVRNIHRYFNELELTPMKYVKRVRLVKAHAELSSPAPGTTVTGTALKCGFSNLGHFARDYRKEFGERPSDTLKGSL